MDIAAVGLATRDTRCFLRLSAAYCLPRAGMTVCWHLWAAKDFQSHQRQLTSVAEHYKPPKGLIKIPLEQQLPIFASAIPRLHYSLIL